MQLRDTDDELQITISVVERKRIAKVCKQMKRLANLPSSARDYAKLAAENLQSLTESMTDGRLGQPLEDVDANVAEGTK